MDRTSPGTILVIDADAAQRERISAWLKLDGFAVVSAADADAGFALARNLKPSLILGDLVLALANGSQLLRALLHELPETSVIVITESASLHEAVNALQEGASDFLIKSLLNDDILRVSVHRAIERFSLRQENQRVRQELEKSNERLAHSLQLLEMDHRAGRKVQSRMLPPTPHESNGLHLSHFTLPSLYLSGDFVDYFSLGPGRTAFYLADVSGHGASSAFVTVFLKTLTNRIRRHFEKRTSVSLLSPARIMAAMSEELRALDTGKHLTVFCGVIDTNQQTLTYAVGAHYPPPILCNGNEVMQLAGSGLPLGLFPDAKYEEHVVALQQRFSLVAASDGILEILPASDLVAKEALLREEVAAADGQLDVLIERLGLPLVRDVPDDIALLMIQRDE